MEENFLSLIYGVYDLISIEVKVDGVQTTEHTTSGMFTFTKNGRCAVVSGTNEFVMAYSGSFKIEGDQLLIHAASCNVREREGTTMSRKIAKLDGDWLILETVNPQRKEVAQIKWKRIQSF